jgi:hypothetical protein
MTLYRRQTHFVLLRSCSRPKLKGILVNQREILQKILILNRYLQHTMRFQTQNTHVLDLSYLI